ncbi:hypothetical protein LCGC14_2723530 [marine sediment metagenome]|uniref:Uncharacterized protein n=1 Tax=marine sediment metagenome TaxID=412755 RepID=A0A0F8Z9E0_9ZZZZ
MPTADYARQLAELAVSDEPLAEALKIIRKAEADGFKRGLEEAAIEVNMVAKRYDDDK